MDTAGIPVFPKKIAGGGEGDAWFLQLWKLVPQPRKMNLLEVSCLAATANKSGAGGTFPTTRAGGRALLEAGAWGETEAETGSQEQDT